MKRFFLCLLIGLATGPAAAQAPRTDMPKLEVSVRRVSVDAAPMYEVSASGAVQAAPAEVWKILTTYERMNEFVPDLAASRVLSRDGNEVIVEQFGTARFLFLSRAIHLIVRATETPMSAIDVVLISGDMAYYTSHWELQPLPETGGTRLLYQGRLIPSFYVPDLLGGRMIRSDIERMMGAVLARLDARPALWAPQAR